MDLSEQKDLVKKNMSDCSYLSGELQRLLHSETMSGKDLIDLAAYVDAQNQMIRRLTLLVSSLVTDEDPWDYSK